MSRLKPLTHEEHLVLAEDFKKTLNDLINIRNRVWQSCGVSSRAAKVLQSVIKKLDISFRGEMDTHYHKVTDSKQFIEQGHAYYNERRE
jgi:hypothetical protein